jgi:hypothetical protein
MARPSKFTQAVANEICNRIAAGESLRRICDDDHLPTRASVHTWLLDADHKPFLDQYEAACDIRAENMADELNEIADDSTNDFMERESKDGGTFTVLNAENVQRSRLRIDTRKWYLSKLRPKKYGEKLDITSGGESLKPEAPVQEQIDNAVGRFLGLTIAHGNKRNPRKS